MELPAVLLRAAGIAAGGALFWLMYFDIKDRLRPEPRRLLVLAFALGNLSAAAGLLLYRAAGALGLPEDPGTRPLTILLYCVGLVGPIEEGVKFLAARLFIFRWEAFDEPIDGLVYAAAVAIGFATFENLLYLPLLGGGEQLARALASPLTHSLFAAVWGFGASRAFFAAKTRLARVAWQVLPLALAMVLHGLYDTLLLAWNATVAGSGITLVLWAFTIAHARRLVRRRRPADVA